jgi:hypothetical protein
MESQGDTKFWKAVELFNLCIDAGCNELPNPVIWVRNKPKMRFMWETYIKDMPKDNVMSYMMLNNAFADYMRYMYENY